jgi:hypothetical protein
VTLLTCHTSCLPGDACVLTTPLAKGCYHHHHQQQQQQQRRALSSRTTATTPSAVCAIQHCPSSCRAGWTQCTRTSRPLLIMQHNMTMTTQDSPAQPLQQPAAHLMRSGPCLLHHQGALARQMQAPPCWQQQRPAAVCLQVPQVTPTAPPLPCWCVLGCVAPAGHLADRCASSLIPCSHLPLVLEPRLARGALKGGCSALTLSRIALPGDTSPPLLFSLPHRSIHHTAPALLQNVNYPGLRTLYDKYSQDGFNLIAFPCNQFG